MKKHQPSRVPLTSLNETWRPSTFLIRFVCVCVCARAKIKAATEGQYFKVQNGSEYRVCSPYTFPDSADENRSTVTQTFHIPLQDPMAQTCLAALCSAKQTDAA